MDHAALLALIGELYATVGRLNAENAQLREALEAAQPAAANAG